MCETRQEQPGQQTKVARLRKIDQADTSHTRAGSGLKCQTTHSKEGVERQGRKTTQERPGHQHKVARLRKYDQANTSHTRSGTKQQRTIRPPACHDEWTDTEEHMETNAKTCHDMRAGKRMSKA